MTDKPNPVAIAKDIHRLTNTFSTTDLNLLAELLVNEHRSLQQSLMRGLVWPLLERWAEDYEDNRYDLRNEDTVKLAAAIVKAHADDAHFQWV